LWVLVNDFLRIQIQYLLQKFARVGPIFRFFLGLGICIEFLDFVSQFVSLGRVLEDVLLGDFSVVLP